MAIKTTIHAVHIGTSGINVELSTENTAYPGIVEHFARTLAEGQTPASMKTAVQDIVTLFWQVYALLKA